MKIFKDGIHKDNDTLNRFLQNHSNEIPQSIKDINIKGAVTLCHFTAFCMTTLQIKETPKLSSIEADRLYEENLRKLFLEVF